MLGSRKFRFRIALMLLIVGAACLAIPPYAEHCENTNSNQYGCAVYEISVSLGRFLKSYHSAITALATIAIAGFTFTL